MFKLKFNNKFFLRFDLFFDIEIGKHVVIRILFDQASPLKNN